jgi:hypothetical protein
MKLWHYQRIIFLSKLLLLQTFIFKQGERECADKYFTSINASIQNRYFRICILFLKIQCVYIMLCLKFYLLCRVKRHLLNLCLHHCQHKFVLPVIFSNIFLSGIFFSFRQARRKKHNFYHSIYIALYSYGYVFYFKIIFKIENCF